MDLTPEIEFAKGVLGQRGGAVIQYIQDFHHRRRVRFENEVLEATGMEPVEIADRIAANEPLAEALENGWDAAERTASDYKIRLLARVVAQALTDQAQIDITQLRMQTFRELEEQQVRALALLSGMYEQRRILNSVEQMIEANTRYKGPRKGSQSGASRQLSTLLGADSENLADAITAALERHGLIWNDPPGFNGWGLTSYGQHIVQFLREIDHGTD